MDAYRLGESIVFPNTKFIYEIELYNRAKNLWNLEDSKYFASKELIEGLADCIVYPYLNYQLVKYTTLVCAPEKWLRENATFFNYESMKEIKKEKTKLKKEQKENEIPK
jgi:hypothetical protein